MALNLQQKKHIVSKINKIASVSLSAVLAKKKKITTNEITKLRKHSRIEEIEIHVVKNTLLKKSLKTTQFECLNKKISGPIIIGFSLHHPGSVAKLFTQFQKKNSNFKILTAAYNKKILTNTEIENLSKLPNLKEAIQKIITIIKFTTVGKLFSILLEIKKKNKIKTIIVK
ncbi:50S ribosomal protein L10 [Buchnera aphidicola]|uniref:50S ribosomal protein L10 n=1 Tax=Buchnera aphidicola TaxID=9 RepID=UPI0031B875AA